MSDLVSILIPVYNIKDYIGKCVESIIQQNYTNIEIIVVDDGSTDGSGEICRQFASQDSRIIYVYQENKGSVGARKTGLVHAKGKYIVFVDGDDYAERDYVEKLYELINENDVDFVHSNYMINGRNQKFIKQVHLYKEGDLNPDLRIELLRDYVFGWDAEKEIMDCNLYGCIYKTDVIYDCFMELPDSQQYGEDLICLCHLIMKCRSMMLIPDAYYHYVIREKSLNHPRKFLTALSDKVSLYEEIERTLRKYKIYSVLSDKCEIFFARRIFGDFSLLSSKEFQVKEKYVCEFIDLLLDRRIVLYGAGIVGQNIYEQLTNYESIEIVGWMDRNYRNIHSPYMDISDPALISALEFDCVIVAVQKGNLAREIIDYLSQMGIDRKLILWQPYSKSMSLSML